MIREIEAIEALDFDIDTACEWQKPPCADKAEWISHMVCCGATGLVCTKHKDTLVEWWNMPSQKSRIVPCGECNAGEAIWEALPL